MDTTTLNTVMKCLSGVVGTQEMAALACTCRTACSTFEDNVMPMHEKRFCERVERWVSPGCISSRGVPLQDRLDAVLAEAVRRDAIDDVVVSIACYGPDALSDTVILQALARCSRRVCLFIGRMRKIGPMSSSLVERLADLHSRENDRLAVSFVVGASGLAAAAVDAGAAGSMHRLLLGDYGADAPEHDALRSACGSCAEAVAEGASEAGRSLCAASLADAIFVESVRLAKLRKQCSRLALPPANVAPDL
jgi:hypothetical protein